jgi:hypothetical protein
VTAATTTPLAERMALHVAGQITWPEPALGLTCDSCRHFDRDRVKTAGRGRCRLVAAHQKTAGVVFAGTATACPKHQRA